jgi:fumarylacetoacetase
VESANQPGCEYPIQNLPFGVFTTGENAQPRMGVRIGDRIVDLRRLALDGRLPAACKFACEGAKLNALLELGVDQWSALRLRLSELLGEDTCGPGRVRNSVATKLIPHDEVTMHLPAAIGDYTDFYASIDHATRVGSFFRPDQPLLPNYKWLPIGYHGRSSSIVASGAEIRRPKGQIKSESGAPEYRPTAQLDYELELGALVGPENRLGEPIPIGAAASHLFGVVLLNDWSARDLQSWEYQPLGPFLAKSFATSISPWVVTWEALAPFRRPARSRPAGDPAPLPHLTDEDDAELGGLDLSFEVALRTARMRTSGATEQRIAVGNFGSMYWTFAQLLSHHTSNGCNLRPGDLLGSGTISGPEPGACGCLLELTARGAQPIVLPDGESRAFLEDGDEVILRGWAERPGARRIGLGECRGVIAPAN